MCRFDSINLFQNKVLQTTMGRAKKTKKFATMKRMISASDPRLKDKEREKPKKAKKEVDIGTPLSLLLLQYF